LSHELGLLRYTYYHKKTLVRKIKNKNRTKPEGNKKNRSCLIIVKCEHVEGIKGADDDAVRGKRERELELKHSYSRDWCQGSSSPQHLTSSDPGELKVHTEKNMSPICIIKGNTMFFCCPQNILVTLYYMILYNIYNTVYMILLI